MNLILFDPSEVDRPLPRNDPRAIHVLDVLQRRAGDSFDAGIINGPRGRATLHAITTDRLELAFAWTTAPEPPEPFTLIIGLPRPQTARDILRDATTLGVGVLHFVRTGRSDPNYAQSTLWTSGEVRRHLIAGAAQAFATRIPEISHSLTLAEALAGLGSSSARVALDNYESTLRLGDYNAVTGIQQVLAIGGERGWSDADRAVLRRHQFTLAQLGSRVLRTETAVVAALSILRMKLGLM